MHTGQVIEMLTTLCIQKADDSPHPKSRQLSADNLNTIQTLEYTKNKYNEKIMKMKGLS
jgi:hypothetical protein